MSKNIDIVLVINCGSSSIKFEVFQFSSGEKVLAKGLVERIGLDSPRLLYKRQDGFKQDEQIDIADHNSALSVVCQKLVTPDSGVLKSLSEIDAIGHRVVHGGNKMTASRQVNEDVKDTIKACFTLSPLHNPPNLEGIIACEKNMPNVPNVAVFDTAFHGTMLDEYKYYAIPMSIYEKYNVRKYGFHGTSHKYVTYATAKFLDKPVEETNLITCHLGNGSSCAAIKDGKVIDTSMGLTPLPGLVMGTRCGDIDASVVLYLIRQGMSADEIDKLLNKQSGLMGVAETGSSDMRDLIEATESGNKKAKLAFDMFLGRLASYIGSYYVAVQNPDAIVFTGGIGENSAYVREKVIERLGTLGCHLDRTANDSTCGKPGLVSTPESTLKAIVMPTNEELMIARDTVRVLKETSN